MGIRKEDKTSNIRQVYLDDKTVELFKYKKCQGSNFSREVRHLVFQFIERVNKGGNMTVAIEMLPWVDKALNEQKKQVPFRCSESVFKNFETTAISCGFQPADLLSRLVRESIDYQAL